MSDAIQRELGEITATLRHLKEESAENGRKLDGIDGRLRTVETKSALNGAISGGVIAVAVAFIKDAWSA